MHGWKVAFGGLAAVLAFTPSHGTAAADAESGSSAASVAERIVGHLKAGRQSEAERLFADTAQRYWNDQRLLFLGAAMKRSRFSIRNSRPLFEAAARLDSNSVPGQASVLIVRIDRRENTEGDFKALESLVAAHPDDTVLRWMLAVQCRALDRNRTGVEQYERIVRDWDPGPSLVHQTYGNVLDELGRYEEALAQRRITVAMEPAGWSYQGLGNTLARLGRYDEAIDAHRKSVELRPNQGDYWTSWGTTLQLANRYEDSVPFLQKAVQLDPGDSDAWANLGNGYHGLRQFEKAMDAYRRALAIDKDNPYVSQRLGMCYYAGEGVTADRETAVRWFRRAAEGGDKSSMCYLGHCLQYGEGIPKNQTEALRWFRTAAEAGSGVGARRLAQFYGNGIVVPKDPAEAARWMRIGAERGDVDAQYNLGVFFFHGKGVKKDGARAHQWFRKAAGQGSVPAMAALGDCYRCGFGVSKDDAEATRWFVTAADRGDARAQDSAGWAYAKGLGVAQDCKEAERWYRKAIAQNYRSAVCHLGDLYEEGGEQPRARSRRGAPVVSEGGGHGQRRRQGVIGASGREDARAVAGIHGSRTFGPLCVCRAFPPARCSRAYGTSAAGQRKTAPGLPGAVSRSASSRLRIRMRR